MRRSSRGTGLRRCRILQPTRTRATRSARWRPFSYATTKTAAFYDSQKRLATEHAVFDDVGHGEPVREAGNGQGALLSSFTVLRLGTSQQAANDPAKRELLAKKEELEQKIDTLKYQKAAMDPADYKKQLTEALLELAKVQEELDK